MLFKLSIRNAKRSMKDYLIYIITMTGVAAFMYAFNSLIFSDIVQSMWEVVMIMTTMIILVTVFIILIVAWLINYMVHFMLEKRSQEFGTYLLLGMSKKQVSKVYMRENMILGLTSLFFGILSGTLLQQIIMTVFYHLFSKDYPIQIGTSFWCLVMTVGCYAFCYLLALRRNRKIFKKMSIMDFMQMGKNGEVIETGHEKWKQWFFFVSIAYFIVFNIWMTRGNYKTMVVIISITLFILAIYLFYHGLSAYLVCYIHKRGRRVYQRDGLFLFRQLSFKMRTMRFTMGTLTFLFTSALIGGAVAMMFASYQKEVIYNSIPFDIMVYSEDAKDTFTGERELLTKEGIQVSKQRIYNIYQDKRHEMNDYLYTHVSNLAGMFLKEDGSLNEEKVKKDGYVYHDYDTYMSLSDYNYLRKMLGYETINLGEEEYLLHLKKRLLRDIEDDFLKRTLTFGNRKLTFAGTQTEGFSQNGINGADYIFVLPDEVCKNLTPYYSVMVMNIKETPGRDLKDKLESCYYHSRGLLTEMEVEEQKMELEEQGASQKEIDKLENRYHSLIKANGSDQIMSVGSYDVAVKDIEEDMILSVISSITFPLAYISLIFVCVALTILAVQQLSDSSRYRYRYDVLRKMGVSNKELDKIVCKQLIMYYLVPIAVSLILSAIIAIFAGERFVFYTGAKNNYLSYFFISVLVFIGIYLLYFAATYLGFKRNIEQVFTRME